MIQEATMPADQTPTVRECGIYVASRASIPERGAMWRRYRDAGMPIVSSWIDEDGPGETADFAELWPRIGREMASARALIFYAEPDDLPVRGVLIEIGMAFAAGIPVFVVAPNVELEGRTFRPLGSWLQHPLVTMLPDLDRAFRAALTTPTAPSEGVAGCGAGEVTSRIGERVTLVCGACGKPRVLGAGPCVSCNNPSSFRFEPEALAAPSSAPAQGEVAVPTQKLASLRDDLRKAGLTVLGGIVAGWIENAPPSTPAPAS